MKDSLTKEEVDTILRLRQRVAELEEEPYTPAGELMRNEIQTLRQQVAELEAQINETQRQYEAQVELAESMSQRVAELEEEISNQDAWIKRLKGIIKERGEQMKAMRGIIVANCELIELFRDWFDETGEPL